MSKRKSIPPAVEATILIESKRRCCLCYHLCGTSDIQLQGQIAHIDRDSSNNKSTNLAYLCIPHHDSYDTTTSQSKGITKEELRHAKEALLAHLTNQDTEQNDEFLTLTLRGDLANFTAVERDRILDVIIKAAGIKHGLKIVQANPGSIQLRVQLDRIDALRLCNAFIDGSLAPTGVVDVTVASRPEPVHIQHMEERYGVSRSQARQVVGAPDGSVFFSNGRMVPSEQAASGIYVKRFGQGDKHYVAFVLTTRRPDETLSIDGAFRAYATDCELPSGSDPYKLLHAFLHHFGVDLHVEGVGTSRFFHGERLTVPLGLNADGVYRHVQSLVGGAGASPSDPRYEVFVLLRPTGISNVVSIEALFAFASAPYFNSLRRHGVSVRRTPST